eukprot:13890576-Heterocapsa_arctica.AAC.1
MAPVPSKLGELKEIGPEAMLDALADTDIDIVPFNDQAVLCPCIAHQCGRGVQAVVCWSLAITNAVHHRVAVSCVVYVKGKCPVSVVFPPGGLSCGLWDPTTS